MKKTLLFFIACCLLTPMSAQAVPSKPLYEPPIQPKAPMPVAINLAGSAWIGTYVKNNRIFIFEADGTLSYKNPLAKGSIFRNRGIWKLDGNTLSFEHYIKQGVMRMEFRGTIQNADTIAGESVTRTGAKMQLSLQRTTLQMK